MAGDVRFGVLGPLTARDAGGPLDLRGPRHRAVLARLLIARGRVVPVRWLVDDLWDDPSEGAVGAIRTFVSALRRGIEPDRPPRAPARLLVTAAPGYALRAAPDAVDAWRFEAAVREAADLPAQRALPLLDEALALWRGPAYAEFAEEDWARGEISRLDELRLLAVERRAGAALASGAAADTVPDLETHVAAHPWREGAWRLLALALYRTGRQADALAVLRRARDTLAGELGLDPGKDLQRLEADILAQSPDLSPAPPPPAVDAQRLVGRAEELARLTEAAAQVVARDRLGLVLLSGDAGAGKTALAGALTDSLAAERWTTAWGHSPVDEGAPAAWPWIEILNALDAPSVLEREPGGDQAAARFRMHRAVAAQLAEAAGSGPLLIVLDDLHRAGEETLALLAALIAEPVPGPVLVVATYRATEISAELSSLLGQTARAEPVRVYLGGLPEAAVHELVQATAYREVEAATARVIHERSGGNPFFVRELARLLGEEGGTALTAVPPGVRDLIRHRLAALPATARTVLRQAAVIGRDVDLDLLVPLAGDEDLVLDAVESALLGGFMTEAGPDRTRFAHALVRDTLYDDVSGIRRARWHTAVAETLERLRPGDVEAIAHHYLRAGTRATASAAARYARAAAERADRRFAPHEAARLWREAVAAHDRSGSTDQRARLEAIMGMVGALAVTGGLESARRHRAAAITAADGLGDPALTARVIGAFDVPAIWTRNDDADLARQVIEITERTLAALPEEAAADRCRLLSTLAMESRGTAGTRGREAAREAEALARRLDDPALLAFALNGRFMQSFERAGLAPERARIGEELVELAVRHDLVTFEVLGHLILVQARSALADFTAADEHAAAADRLAARYELPLVGVFTEWYGALKLAAAGRTAEAEAAYRTAAARLGGTGMWGVEDGLLPLALLCLRVQEGRLGDIDPHADWGPYADWCRPLSMLAAGHPVDASAVPASPPDLLLEARTVLAAVLALATGDRPAMERAHATLLPAAGELAGAGSGLITLGPVTRHLDELARALSL